MADSSFDIASKVDDQEIDNAINQALKEINNRYDLKDSKSDIEFNHADKKIVLTSCDDFKIKFVLEIFQQKLVKRGISLKALDCKDIEKASGSTARQEINLQQGIPIEKAKQIVKDIKAEKIKVQAQIQGDQVRVSGKKLDDLQAVIALVKGKKYDIDIQFINKR
jgi:cyclic-di-GMP-binding protein